MRRALRWPTRAGVSRECRSHLEPEERQREEEVPPLARGGPAVEPVAVHPAAERQHELIEEDERVASFDAEPGTESVACRDAMDREGHELEARRDEPARGGAAPGIPPRAERDDEP